MRTVQKPWRLRERHRQGMLQVAAGRRDTKVAWVIETAVPLELLTTLTWASSCCASAFISVVPRPARLSVGLMSGNAALQSRRADRQAFEPEH